MAIRLLHLADLHLGANGSLSGAVGETRRRDFQKAFDAAMDFAIAKESKVDAVMICGDLFDTHSPVPALVSHVQSQFDRLRQQNVHILLVPGFHDAYVYPDSIYRSNALSGIHLLLDPGKKQPVSFDIRGVPVHFYGVAWQTRKGTIGEALRRKDVLGLHIALLHGHLQSAEDSLEVPFRFKLEELEGSGMDYVALGYRHTYTEIPCTGPTIAYCGALEATTLDEVDQRALLVASFQVGKAKTKLTLLRTAYKARPVLQQVVDLASVEIKGGVQGLAGYLMKFADRQTLARLELTGDVGYIVDAERVTELLAPHFLYLELEDHTRFSGSEVVQSLSQEPTIRGSYTQQLLATRKELEDPSLLENALKSVLRRCLEEELL